MLTGVILSKFDHSQFRDVTTGEFIECKQKLKEFRGFICWKELVTPDLWALNGVPHL